jgi:hypothetical protein
MLEALQCKHNSCVSKCITSRCRKSRCILKLPSDGVICVDRDKCGCFQRDAKKPDFIVLCVGRTPAILKWVVVEIKTRVRDPGDIAGQLQAGAHAIQNNTHFKVNRGSQDLIPLLLHDRHIRTADFTRKRITFQGKFIPVVHKHCGVAISDIL